MNAMLAEAMRSKGFEYERDMGGDRFRKSHSTGAEILVSRGTKGDDGSCAPETLIDPVLVGFYSGLGPVMILRFPSVSSFLASIEW